MTPARASSDRPVRGGSTRQVATGPRSAGSAAASTLRRMHAHPATEDARIRLEIGAARGIAFDEGHRPRAPWRPPPGRTDRRRRRDRATRTGREQARRRAARSDSQQKPVALEERAHVARQEQRRRAVIGDADRRSVTSGEPATTSTAGDDEPWALRPVRPSPSGGQRRAIDGAAHLDVDGALAAAHVLGQLHASDRPGEPRRQRLLRRRDPRHGAVGELPGCGRLAQRVRAFAKEARGGRSRRGSAPAGDSRPRARPSPRAAPTAAGARSGGRRRAMISALSAR